MLPIKGPSGRISRQSGDGFDGVGEQDGGPLWSVERAPFDLGVESVVGPEHDPGDGVDRDGEGFVQVGGDHLEFRLSFLWGFVLIEKLHGFLYLHKVFPPLFS